jgi:quinol monooxygenase YgiN
MSAPEPIVVIAHWTTQEESVGRVLALVAELRERSLEEPGCLGYAALQSVGTREAIVLIERYADAAALEAHRNTKHYRELLIERVLPMLTSRQVELLRPFEMAR